MLFGRRKQLARVARAEAKGRSFWTENLDEQARFKLLYAIREAAERDGYLGGVSLIAIAQQLTLWDLGLPRLAKRFTGDVEKDGLQAILDADESVVLSLIEALVAISWETRQRFPQLDAQTIGDFERKKPKLEATVRTILREHRVKYDLINGRFVPIESLEMHETVIIPTLTLLGSRKDFERVERAYQKALRELHSGSPGDAVTDAGTALQEALVALGCSGNRLGQLAKSAESKGLITGYDRKLVDWVSADRSNKGDSHNAIPASTEDAWLAVRVVGALIVRVSEGTVRRLGGR